MDLSRGMTIQNKRNRFIFSLKLITIVSVLVGFAFVVKEAGNFLNINENVEHADVIIILSGGELDRIERGVELYKQGISPFLMISNGSEDQLYEATLSMGVPSDAIILENQANSTLENAHYTVKLMKEYQFTSAIVISSNYHMRRVKENFDREVKNTELKLIYSSSNYDKYKPNSWWKSAYGIHTTFAEYSKIIGNYFGLHGDIAKRVLELFL